MRSGTVIDRYRIDAVIGSGSMGEVYRAFDVDLERTVALKILSEHHRENDELRARFVREGRAVAQITHPNVVQVFATGTHDDRPYIAMEMLRGVDLESAVQSHGPWSSRPTARAILDAARGLEAAAAAGLIHRDVKPSNLVLLESGIVKVTDFGLAKPLDPSRGPALTAQGVVVGTPDYIAPEQARGDPIDERIDIYALGGTIYFLLAGSPPFRTGDAEEDKYLKVVARHLKLPAPSALAKARSADRELAELARSMMAKRAAERPSYADVASALSAIVRRLASAERPADATPAPARPRTAPTPFVGGDRAPSDPPWTGPKAAAAPPAATADAELPGAGPDRDEEPRPRRRGRALAIALAAVLALALALAGAFALGRDGAGDGATTSEPAPPP